jgi:hypothetical protein
MTVMRATVILDDENRRSYLKTGGYGITSHPLSVSWDKDDVID